MSMLFVKYGKDILSLCMTNLEGRVQGCCTEIINFKKGVFLWQL